MAIEDLHSYFSVSTFEVWGFIFSEDHSWDGKPSEFRHDQGRSEGLLVGRGGAWMKKSTWFYSKQKNYLKLQPSYCFWKLFVPPFYIQNVFELELYVRTISDLSKQKILLI